MQAKTVRLWGHGGHVLAVPCIKRFHYQTAEGPAIAVAIHRRVLDVVSGKYGRGYAVVDIASGRRIAYLATRKRLPVAEMVADATQALNEVVVRVGLDRFHAVIASAPALPAQIHTSRRLMHSERSTLGPGEGEDVTLTPRLEKIPGPNRR